jgi:hypothetical protein
MGTVNLGLVLRKREDQTVARRTYLEKFRRDAVELYRSRSGRRSGLVQSREGPDQCADLRFGQAPGVEDVGGLVAEAAVGGGDVDAAAQRHNV